MLVTFLYNFHPRLTFLYLYLFKYENMFLPLLRSQLNMQSKMGEEGEGLGEELTPHVLQEQGGGDSLEREKELWGLHEERWKDKTDYADEEEGLKEEKPSVKATAKVFYSTCRLLLSTFSRFIQPYPVLSINEIKVLSYFVLQLRNSILTLIFFKLSLTLQPLEPSTRQLIAIAIETLLVPHVVVMVFVYTYFSKDAVLFYALMFHCGMSTFVELKLLRSRLRHPRGREQYSFRYS